MLPERALALINEYSKPITRPDWRRIKPTNLLYFSNSLLNYHHIKYSQLSNIVVVNMRTSDIFVIGQYIQIYGVYKYLMDTDDDIEYIRKNNYLIYADHLFEKRKYLWR